MPLIDRIRLAHAQQPELPLALLCVAVGDTRTEMVATLRRMVQLATVRAQRGNVQAPQTIPSPTIGTCPHPRADRTGSLRASSPVTGSR